MDSGRGKWAKQLLDDTKKAMATGSVASAIDEDEETTRKEEQKEGTLISRRFYPTMLWILMNGLSLQPGI